MTTYNTAVAADNPTIYFKLDETTGTTFANSGSSTVSTMNKGTGATLGAPGPSGTAVALDGTANGNISINTVSATEFPRTATTIEMWFKSTDSNVVLARLGVVGAVDGWSLQIDATGKVLFKWSSGITMTSTTAKNDGQWHHVVAQVCNNDNTANLFIDGVNHVALTAVGVASPANAQLMIGDNTDAAAPAATVDEFAVYRVKLSTTSISNHYTNASLNASVNYTVTAATATALMPNPVVTATKIIPVNVSTTPATATALSVSPVASTTRNVNNAVPAVTASATMVNPAVTTNFKSNGVSEDAAVFNDAPTTVFNGDVARVQNDGTVGDDWFLFKLVNPQPGETLVSVKVKLTGSAASTDVFTPEIHRITGAWNESTVTYNTMPAMTGADRTLAPITTAAGVVNTIDLTSVVNLGYTNGIAIKSATFGAGYFYTKDAVNPANRPVVEWVYSVGHADVTTPALPATATATAVAPVVSTTRGINFLVTTATASALAVDPTLFVQKDMVINVTPATGTADAGSNNGFLRQVRVDVTPATGSGLSLEPQVGVQRGPRIAVAPATGSISFVQPALVNGSPIVATETDDAYFQKIFARKPLYYFRLNEQNGVTYGHNRMAPAGFENSGGLYFHGIQSGKHDGPDGRASVYFDGNAYIEQDEANASGDDERNVLNYTAFEFSFRTSKANQFIFAQLENPNRDQMQLNELWMVNGKLVYRNQPINSVGKAPLREMTGRNRLDDGRWHTVVIRYYERLGEGGTEIWVDGQFDVRRHGFSPLTGFPDFIGARYEQWDFATEPALPGSQYFVGDMTELSLTGYTSTTSLSSDEISRSFYAFQGWAPISVSPAEGSAEAGNARGKGNQKKALYLYWDLTSESQKPGTYSAESQYYRSLAAFADPNDVTVTSLTNLDKTDFDPMPGFVWKNTQSTPFTQENVGDYHGFKVFSRPVYVGPYNDYQGYRDQWTDDFRLIDLEQDIDLEEYDVIMFKDWPDEGGQENANQLERDFFEQRFPGQRERLIDQLLDANDKGIGLYVTNPTMAADLGIVGGVEFTSTLTEQRFLSRVQQGSDGLYDYGSAYKFPWNIAATDGVQQGNPLGVGRPADRSQTYLDTKALFYADNNRNNKFRVRALIENLTDIGSYMIEDAVYHREGGDWANDGVAFKYLHRMNGLQIGDEYVFNGLPMYPGDDSGTRNGGTWATPMKNVIAGTVVTTFGATHWFGRDLVENPYKDYVTTIVVQPGDVLGNGRVVNGKIFVNFTEAPSYGVGVKIQVTPWSTEAQNDPDYAGLRAPNGWPEETAEQKAWEFSFTRTSGVHIALDPKNFTVYKEIKSINKYGTPTYVPQNKARAGLSIDRTFEVYPLIGYPRWEMDGRGMFWLSIQEKTEPGSAHIRVGAVTATAKAVDPKVTAEHPATINVEAAIGNATLVKPKEDQTGDVTILVLPATGFAEITGKSVTISVPPATATAEFVENFDMVHTQGDHITLTLHGYDATLFIKEEA